MKVNPSKIAIAVALIAGMTTDPEFRARATEIVIAKAIAYSCPLPSSPVESVPSHYALTCKAYVEEVVSTLSETTVFNVRNVLGLTAQMYTARYNVCHVPRMVDDHRFFDAVVASAKSTALAGPYRSIFEQLGTDTPIGNAGQLVFSAINDEE